MTVNARAGTTEFAPGHDGRITRADLEAKLQEIRGEADTAGESAKSVGLIVGGIVVVALVGAAFLLGKRRGRRRSTIVEIRRV